MSKERTGICFLTGNMLKIMSAVLMLVDHIGMIFFPGEILWRIIARPGYPMLTFMIAEGSRYTKSKPRYLAMVSLLAAVCQIAYSIYDGELYMCALVGFALGIVMIYALQNFKNKLFSAECNNISRMFAAALFVLSVAVVYFINCLVKVDYGFWGCMMPVFASVFHQPENAPESLKKLDCIPVHVCMMGICLILQALDWGGVQMYCLIGLPILLLYSGTRGKYRMKYFFYLFYPLHLVILEGLYMLLH